MKNERDKFKERIKINETTEERQEGETVKSQIVEFLCGDSNNQKVTKVVEKMLNERDIEK